MTFTGHPDWTPSLRGYAAGLVVPFTVTNVPAATQWDNHALPADQLYDVNVVQVMLPHLCMVAVASYDDVAHPLMASSVLNPYAADQSVHIPIRNQGNLVAVWFFNFDTVDHPFTWAVRGYNGVPSVELTQPPITATAYGGGAGTGVFAFGPTVAGLALYDRMAWTAWGTGPFDVVARSWFPQGSTTTTADIVLGSSTAGEGITGEAAIGAVGLALGMVDTGSGLSTVEMTVRAWHDN